MLRNARENVEKDVEIKIEKIIISKEDFEKCFDKRSIVSKQELLRYYLNKQHKN